jgi:hypothetical protein
VRPETAHEASGEPARPLDERDITDLITVYRNSAAPSLTAALGLNLKSIKRLLHIAGG